MPVHDLLPQGPSPAGFQCLGHVPAAAYVLAGHVTCSGLPCVDAPRSSVSPPPFFLRLVWTLELHAPLVCTSIMMERKPRGRGGVSVL